MVCMGQKCKNFLGPMRTVLTVEWQILKRSSFSQWMMDERWLVNSCEPYLGVHARRGHPTYEESVCWLPSAHRHETFLCVSFLFWDEALHAKMNTKVWWPFYLISIPLLLHFIIHLCTPCQGMPCNAITALGIEIQNEMVKKWFVFRKFLPLKFRQKALLFRNILQNKSLLMLLFYVKA